MEEVQTPDISADHPVLYDQHGSLRKEFPDGIRPDHGYDKGGTGTEYGIDLLPDLQQWSFRRKFWLSERQCGCIFHRDRGNLGSADVHIK